MHTVALSCNRCGAPLQAQPTTRFLTCSHCNTRLKVISGGGATYTEQLEDIRDSQERIEGDLETIQLQNELERVDREWATRERGFERVDNQGRRSLPTDNAGPMALVSGVITVAAVIFFLAKSMDGYTPGFVPLLLFGVLGTTIYQAVKGYSAAEKYQDARKGHEARRASLVAKLEQRNPLGGQSSD